MKNIILCFVFFFCFASFCFSQNKNDNTTIDTLRAYEIKDLDEMAEYVGGYTEMINYFFNNFKYPSCQKERLESTKILISFSVKRDGSLSNFKIVKSIDQLIDEEAIRIFKSMPKWNPGKIQGTAVKVEKVVIPILIHFE